MQYTQLQTDYDTGEVFRISIGEHLTFTETAISLEVGRRTLNKAMLEGSLCVREHDDVAKKDRIRLHPEAVKKGLGHRIMGSKGPFDVLSPVGREVAENMLRDYLRSTSPEQWNPAFDALKAFEDMRKEEGFSPLSAKMRYSWLEDHIENIPIDVIAKGIGVSLELVYRFKRIRDSQIEKAQRGLLIGATFSELFEAA